jgi:CRP/FNR family cyclic AMP-dependent transcriptional regulator
LFSQKSLPASVQLLFSRASLMEIEHVRLPTTTAILLFLLPERRSIAITMVRALLNGKASNDIRGHGPMKPTTKVAFDPSEFLAHAGLGRRVVHLKAKGVFFSQGNAADSIFFLQTGRARVTVVSKAGKEATITLLAPGDFIGEESIAAVLGLRLATATAITDCTALKIERKAMILAIDQEHELSNVFVAFLLERSMRVQADLVDQLFNNSEKRLARILLLMAEFGQPGKPEMLIPHITQETLADMIGTTRSRVSFFMNRFRKLGFIEYNGRIHVHGSLLNVVLHDGPPGHNSVSASLIDKKRDKTKAARKLSMPSSAPN